MQARDSVLARRVLIATAVATALIFIVPDTVDAADQVMCRGEVADIVGTPGNDVGDNAIYGTEGDDVIHGLGGRDQIYGLGGNDLICGGAGNDRIWGGSGADTIWSHSGHDVVRGGRGNDIIYSGHGNDRVWGKGGKADEIKASRGADVCIAENETNCELDRRRGYVPEDWLDLLDQYFGDIGQTWNARVVLGCESLGEPFIVNDSVPSRPSGLFQYKDWIWDWRTEGTAWQNETRFHPEASVATARGHFDWALEHKGYGWQPWVNCGCHPDIDDPLQPETCDYKK